MKSSLGISNFLEEISSVSHSIVFLYFFALITEERLSYLSLLFFGNLYSDLLLYLFLLQWWVSREGKFYRRAKINSQGNGFDHHFLYNVMNLYSYFFRHSIRYNPLNLFVTSTVQLWEIWFRSYLEGLVVFPNFNLVAIRSSWSEPQSVPSLIFADCIELLCPWLQKNIINLIFVLTIWWCPCVEPSIVFLEGGVCYEQYILLAKLC